MNHFFRMTVGTLLACGLLASQAAIGHSLKESTRPADGAVLAAPPEKVGMSFDRPMRVILVSLTDRGGNEYTLTRQDNMQPVEVFDATAPELPVGVYTVKWRGLADDGHPMQGTFSFKVSE